MSLLVLFNQPASGTPTGTLATTNANDTLSASGIQTNTGTLARANANDSLASSGTQTNTGTFATTNASDGLASNGTQTNTGTLVNTNANDTFSSSGTQTNTGTLAKTNANDSLAASGTAGSISGTLATTNANDTLAASGYIQATGTLAKTNANDALSARGTAGAPLLVIDTHDGGKRTAQRFKRNKEKLREDVEAAYSALMEAINPVVQEAKQIAAPALKGPTPRFDRLPVERMQKLIELHEAQLRQDDEEAAMILLM